MVPGLLLLAACGGEEEVVETGPPPTTFGGDRPVELMVPSGYDAAEPAPLVMLLHGLGVSGKIQEVLFKLGPEADERGMLFAYPQGTTDSEGRPFWNATDLCCDFDGTGVDDSGYLLSLVDEIADHYNVDPKRIYFTGHSNGHFMSYRMACDHSERVAAIAGFAGAMYSDPSMCGRTAPVNVLHIHGTADDLVPYDMAAEPSTMWWAEQNGCEPDPVTAEPRDLEEKVDGAETEVRRWEGCDPGGATELWSMGDGAHIPNFTDEWGATLLDWLLAHPKP